MMRKALALLRSYAGWMRQLPQASGLLFAARTPLGRSIKMALFAIGVVLPLGSLIWVLLFWHGNAIVKASSLPAG